MGKVTIKSWRVDERRYFWSCVWNSIIDFSNNRAIPFQENNDGKDIFSEERMYVEGNDTKAFNTWHIFTWRGALSSNFKSELRKMYNGENSGWYHDYKNGEIESWYYDEHSKQKMAMKFNKTYTVRRIRNEREEGLTLADNDSKEETTIWISKIRKMSLQNQAASVMSRSIENVHDIDNMVKIGVIPVLLSPIIKEYM